MGLSEDVERGDAFCRRQSVPAAQHRAEQARTARERHLAVRQVAGTFARDAADLALLLDALGLDPAEGTRRIRKVA